MHEMYDLLVDPKKNSCCNGGHSALSDVIEDIEDRGTERSQKLLALAVLATTIIFAHLTFYTVSIIYVENYESTNDWMVFGLSPVVTLALLIILPIIANRTMPRLAILDFVWFRWNRWEFLLFWLLLLGIYVSRFILFSLANKYGLPITGHIFPHLDNAYPILGLYIWLAIFGALLFPVAEEIFWRGYVLSTLMRICHPAVAVLGQAVLFGCFHFRPLMGFAEASLFGLILGLWRYKRRTLLPVIVAHVVINSAAYGWHGLYLLEENRVRIRHDYVAEFIGLSKPAGYDPNDDAREDYAKAGQLFVEFPDELKEVCKRYPTQWSPAERAQAGAWVISSREALDLIEKGTRKPYYWVEYEHQSGRMPTIRKGLEKMRDFVSALCMRAMLRTAAGRYNHGFDDIETCYRLERHLAANKEMICPLVGYACRGLALRTTRMMLAHAKIDRQLLSELQSQLEEFPEEDALGFDLAADKFLAMDVIQCIFTDDGQGGGHIPRSAFRKMRFPEGEYESLISYLFFGNESDAKLWKNTDRRTVTSEVNQYYSLAEKACHLSPWQYNENAGGMKTGMEGISERNPLIKVYSPAIDRLVSIAGKARVDRHATIAILAVLRYETDTGQLPDTLAELVSTDYLRAVPDDTFHNGPLIYRRGDDDFILYSFGADFDDDGGTPSKWGAGEEGGDQVFWPIEQSK